MKLYIITNNDFFCKEHRKHTLHLNNYDSMTMTILHLAVKKVIIVVYDYESIVLKKVLPSSLIRCQLAVLNIIKAMYNMSVTNIVFTAAPTVCMISVYV